MQIHILPTQNDQRLKTQPQLLYTSKLTERDFRHRRNIHAHPNMVEFVYVVSGSGEYDIGNARYPVTAGDLIIYNSNTMHCEFLSHQNHSILCCAATNIEISGLEPNCVLPDTMSPVIHLGDNRHLFQQLMQTVWDTASSGLPHSFDTCQLIFQSLLRLTMDIIENGESETAKELSHQSPLSQQIRQYVDSQPIEGLSAPGVAKVFNISESYCARVFKQAYDCSLTTYLIQKKIGEAQTLLLTSDLSIKEIGDRVGYPNQSYFSKIFTQTVGTSPLRYQKMYCHTPKNKAHHTEILRK